MRYRVPILIASAAVSAFLLWGGNEVRVSVHFDKKLQIWDGFGVNYVEVAQTRDYLKDPQEYGGFSTLSEAKRGEILDMTFGPDGLKPALVKMFLDPWHEGTTEAGNDNNDPNTINPARFDHKTCTKWMRYYVQEGLKRNRARGASMEILTTLYGPPAWMTKQKFMRGRDLDPRMKEELGEYLVAWVKFLREEEKLPVKWIGLHNEGEDFGRWPTDASWGGYPTHDYNAYWHCSQVAEFLRLLRPMFDRQGMKDVGLSPGETSNWERFINWGYAWAIYNDPVALKNLGLITSHGFGMDAPNTSMGVDLLRLARPELHAWTTSMSWGQMDVRFLEGIRQQIYNVKVNGVIPWAAVQTNTWVGGDPNPGTAFRVDRKGGYTVEPGYYYYKQVSRIGQPGMAVAEVRSEHPDVRMIAFSSNGTGNPDAFAVYNLASGRRNLIIDIQGTAASKFDAYTTDRSARFQPHGEYSLHQGALWVTLSAEQVVTLITK